MKNLDLIYNLKDQYSILAREYDIARDKEIAAHEAWKKCILKMLKEYGTEETAKITGHSIKRLVNMKFEWGLLES